MCYNRSKMGKVPSHDIKIFVLQHAPVTLPSCYADRTTYIPMQCGAAINSPVEGTLKDNVGDNISDLNARYNEMTAIYWLEKHYQEIGNPEYIGIDHYRRFLKWKDVWLTPRTVIARKWFSWRTLYNQYKTCHDIRNLDAFTKAFTERFGSAHPDFKRYWGTHFFYICNIFIMHRDEFHRYAKFIIGCIDLIRELESRDVLVKATTAYQSRTPGFILEEMTSYWLWHESRIGNIKIIPSRISHFNIENPVNDGAPLKQEGFLWRLRKAY